jgi:putative peptidoglycan lipid II flippase
MMADEDKQKVAATGAMSRGHRFLRRQSVAQAAVFLSIVTLFSKFIGFARDAIVAHNWGATGLTDAFLIGMMVPSVLLGIVSTGLSTLIVPWYIDHRKQDPARARELVNQVTFVWGMAFLAMSVIVLACAPQLVHLFAPSFTDFRYDLAVKVTRLLVPMGFFNVMTGLVTGLSQAEGQFVIPLVSNVVGNVVMVGCLVFFSSSLGIQSYSLGQTIMSVIGFAPIVWFLLRRRGFFRHLDMRHVDWRAIGSFAALLVPLVISGGGGSLNTIVALAATPIVTAVFPWFSSMAVDGTSLATFEDRIRKTVALMIYIMVPCIAGLVVLAEPIVRLLFQRGAFNTAATHLTAACVQMYCLGLLGQALFPVFHRVFYSFKDTRTPLVVGVAMIAINAVTDWLFGMWFGAAGIALSTTAAVTVGTIMDALLVRRFFRGEVRTTRHYPLVSEILRTLVAVIPVVGIALLAKSWIGGAQGFSSVALRLVLVCGVAAVCYMACSAALHIDGWRVLLGRLRRRLPAASPFGSGGR